AAARASRGGAGAAPGVAELAAGAGGMAQGLLHHRDGVGVGHLRALARQAVKPGGRLVTFVGGFVPGQSVVARALLRMGRGRFVRTREAYLALARAGFGRVEAHVRHDLLFVPYTHLIMCCEKTVEPVKMSA